MILRNLLLFLSRRPGLRRWLETSSLARPLTSRFIAGRSLDEGVAVCRRLNADGLLVTLDCLGENVHSPAEAKASRDAYLEAIHTIAKLDLQATISVKLTQLGLDLSEELCREEIGALVSQASAVQRGVEVDMESARYVDKTLAIVRDLHARHVAVRAVIQAYLYRSKSDLETLCREGVPVRLCKGAYREPASVAFARKRQVDENYLRLLRILLETGNDPAIATHDPKMLEAAIAIVRERRLPPERFEFQMLYGIRRDLQQRLAKEGFRLRLYVPYGGAWYPYFMRRLAERPANLLFLTRNLFRH
jgi:proline dehydrogenase